MKPPSTPVVKTVVVDVIEEPVPGVVVVTEYEIDSDGYAHFVRP